MALMTWDQKYSVGVKAIDSQHSVLFGLINDLHGAMLKGEGKSMTGQLLEKLADYTQTHFVAEEKMMEAASYPGLAQHRVKHRELIKKLEGYSARFKRGESTLNLHLMNFLRDWLTNHILEVDHEYSPCMKSRGIQ
jgi:hemerythrin-like metal-binding protein